MAKATIIQSLKVSNAVFSVAVRERGGTYIARCEGLTASCTYSRQEAAKRAAAKAFTRSCFFEAAVKPEDVRLMPIGPDLFSAQHQESSHGA